MKNKNKVLVISFMVGGGWKIAGEKILLAETEVAFKVKNFIGTSWLSRTHNRYYEIENNEKKVQEWKN